MNLADLPLSTLVSAINFTPAFLFEFIILAPRDSADSISALLARIDPTKVVKSQPPIRTALALRQRDLEEAGALVGSRYAARGYLRDPAEAMPAPDQAPRPGCFTLIARCGEETIGTVTLGFDVGQGLLADEGRKAEIAALRAEGRQLCELVRLAVAEHADSTRTLAALFNAAYGLGHVHHATDLLIEVLPKHMGFYKRSLGFDVVGDERVCPRVGVRSVLLRLDVMDLSRRIGDLQRALAEVPL